MLKIPPEKNACGGKKTVANRRSFTVYRITAVMKVETDIITVSPVKAIILVIVCVETIKTGAISLSVTL